MNSEATCRLCFSEAVEHFLSQEKSVFHFCFSRIYNNGVQACDKDNRVLVDASDNDDSSTASRSKQ